MKSKVTAAILALLLGGFGAHKFYLDKTGQGLVYLLLCWTFIPAFLAFFEGIYYLLMDERKFQKKYGRQQHRPAAAGAGTQNAQNVTINMPGQGNNLSVSDELAKLNELRAAGALTDEEFQAQKQKLLQ